MPAALLSQRDLRAVLDLLAGLEGACGSVGDLEAGLRRRLPALIPCDGVWVEAAGDDDAEAGAEAGTSVAACRPGAADDRGDAHDGHAPNPPRRLVIPVGATADTAAARWVIVRSHARFTHRERELARAMQPHLAFLHTHACREAGLRHDAPGRPLTPREHDVLNWLACGKTDVEIAAVLGISPRTVHKHLEHVYVKLGVETRTAAVMRLWGPPRTERMPRSPSAA